LCNFTSKYNFIVILHALRKDNKRAGMWKLTYHQFVVSNDIFLPAVCCEPENYQVDKLETTKQIQTTKSRLAARKDPSLGLEGCRSRPAVDSYCHRLA